MTSKRTINQIRWLLMTLVLVAAMVVPYVAWEEEGDENGQTTTYFTQYKVTFKLNKKIIL